MKIKSSSKRANIRTICIACLCSPSSRTFYYFVVKPQVTFASLSSPAVMDIRRLRRRLLEINFILKCESSVPYLSFSIAFMFCLLLISSLMSAIVAFISAICSLHISFLTSKRMRHAYKEIKAKTKVNPIILSVAVDPFK